MTSTLEEPAAAETQPATTPSAVPEDPLLARDRVSTTPMRSRLGRWSLLLLAVLASVGAVLFFASRTPGLPTEARGRIVFVSDRSGVENLYLRDLPDGRDRRLTDLDEPVRDPALSPDGRRVAFVVGGRVGLVDAAGGPARMLSLERGWRDETPVWTPDGRALLVAARTTESSPRDIHRLSLDPAGDPVRRPLIETPHLDESEPAVSPDGARIVFVREDHLYRMDADGAIARRITGGFRKARSPRFLPSGRLVFLWTEGKEYGIDVMDADGKARETLQKGSSFYRRAAPSPDGRFLAATFAFDLSFHPWEALKAHQYEHLRLIDLQRHQTVEIAASWRYANHDADWGR
jgi:hypothetical protein